MRMLVCWVVLAVSVAATARADDWPQWFGPKRDGVWRETGILDKFPTGGPKELWRSPIGIGYTGPAVASGKVFTIELLPADGEKLPASGFSKDKVNGIEQVACRDAATGKQLWAKNYPVNYTISYAAGPRCTPTVDGNLVYTLGAMGDLRCYTTDKGDLVWATNFVKDHGASVPVWGFAAHPLVDGDKLICLGGGEDKLVIAFDKKTGKELWASQSCQGDFGYCPPVILEFAGKRHVVIWHARAVVGLDPESGKRLWNVEFVSKAALTAPMPRKVGTDQLFITSFYHGSMLLKVGADKADIVWKSKAKGEGRNVTTDLSSIMPTPWVDGDHVYGVCSYGQLRCIKAATGERVWETMQATRGKRTPEKVAQNPEADESERWSNAFLIPHEGRYFLFNEQGDLIIARLTPKGYEELDRAHLIDPTNTMVSKTRLVVWMHPAFANKCIFVRNDKELVCYSLAK